MTLKEKKTHYSKVFSKKITLDNNARSETSKKYPLLLFFLLRISISRNLAAIKRTPLTWCFQSMEVKNKIPFLFLSCKSSYTMIITMKRPVVFAFPIIIFLNMIFLGLLISVYLKIDSLIQSQKNIYKTTILSEELKHSSDDLTRAARSYAATGDESYLKEFNHLLEVRSGVKPRSLNTLVEPGKTIPFSHLLKSLSPTASEYQKLKDSEDASNNLTQLEDQSFNAMKGVFKDSNGQYTVHRVPDQKFATSLLFSEEYFRQKRQIMQPIYEFQREIFDRMYRDFEQADTQTKRIIYYFIFALIASTIFVYVIYIRLNKLYEENTLYQQDLEQMVTEKTKKLEVSQRQIMLQEKLASVGILAAGLAHEIKNPLNIILNAAEVCLDILKGSMVPNIESLKKSPAPNSNLIEIDSNITQLIQMSEMIVSSSARADSTIKKILRQSYSGKPVLKKIMLKKFLEEAISLAHHSMRATKPFQYNLKNEIANVGEVAVYEQELCRVVINVLDNSFDALIEKQNASKESFKPEIVFYCSCKNGQVVIKIHDNGVGIPEEIQNRVMEPFFTTKATGHGSGLGLSMSSDIIRMHRGNIYIHSKVGEFTEVEIVFPDNLEKIIKESEEVHESKFIKHSIR